MSLLNDAASEMLTPLLPIFLTATLGAGPAVVGLVEGVAEATASLLKLVSGRLADRGWNAKGMVVGGYAVSNAARPLIGAAFGWSWVLGLRFLDRVGKGVRTTPRDALISGAVHPARRGRAFGFQRAMDHLGAMIGPLAAFFLLRADVTLRHVFFASAIPGLAVVALVLIGVPDETVRAEEAPPPLHWRALDGRVRALVLAAGGLALASVPEAFLVLWATSRGLPVTFVPLLWAAAHAGKALVAAPAGRLSDRTGRLPVVVAGWSARVLLLLVLATVGDGWAVVWGAFLAYAAALASTEGAERALIGDFAPAAQKATAFGIYHLTTGLLALPGALLFGGLWEGFGSGVAFTTAAALTALSAGALVAATRRARR